MDRKMSKENQLKLADLIIKGQNQKQKQTEAKLSFIENMQSS
jgi:hypothetical protein